MIVHPERLADDALDPRKEDLAYSVRRYFVDEFFSRRVRSLAPGSTVVDVGGIKGRKRGQFDISKHPFRVVTVNTSESAAPDIRADASSIPLESASADAVILAEVVEHLPEPGAALREAARLLRSGGALLATAPFMFRVHPDPIDIGRYTPQWWEASLHAAGFATIEVEQQGTFFSVLAEMLRGWAMHMRDSKSYWPGIEPHAASFVAWVRTRAMAHENHFGSSIHAYYQSFATGYGIWAVKR